MEHFRILIVDDVADNLKVMTAMIDKHSPNCEVFQTNNPTSVIEIARKTKPDLIITDWDMPNISGIELIRKIKADDLLKAIPVIMATGVMLTVDDLREALEAGAIDYIRKPLNPIELKARMHSALMITKMHHDNLKQKDSELAEKALLLVKNNEFNVEIKRKLDNFAELIRLNGPELDIYNTIIEEIDHKIQSNSWERFEIAFKEVHPLFNANLMHEYSNLTPSDLRLCTFVKMGMSNKEIASVLYQSADSIKVSRSRLRKKLKLEQGKNLETFLTRF